MSNDVVRFDEVDRAQVDLVGGKGANLGELCRIDGIRVPDGFCVTTEAYARVVAAAPSLDELVDRLGSAGPDDSEEVRRLCARIRATIEGIAVPEDLAAEIGAALARLGDDAAYAVRSSATAEDRPTTSFAGQHDSFLHVVGTRSVLDHVRRCWASLFSDRAVAYRRQRGVEHRALRMAVVVQRMVDAQVSGVMFTADPVTSNRRIATVAATPGLGEELVSGRVDADTFEVRDDVVVARATGTVQRSTHAARAESGAAGSALQDRASLTDEQVVRLVQLGRRIEAHFGQPQDIEWCLAEDVVEFVQTRPITTLFPIPVRDDAEPHVYVSVGHQQMMTDPMTPLGRSLFQTTALRPMYEAAGRLFVDVTDALASPTSRAAMVAMMGRSDPLIGDALGTVLAGDDLLAPVAEHAADGADPGAPPAPGPLGVPADVPAADAAVVDDLVERARASIARVQREVRSLQGTELLDAIVADIAEMRGVLSDPQSLAVIMAGMDAAFWLNEHLEEWLGEKNMADVLAQSVPHNVTSEMGLALLDVADAIRPHPEVVAHLRGVDDADVLDALTDLDGGPDARRAIEGFLDRYGMRCVGEIDIARPRWSERPDELVPAILGNVDHFGPGEGARRFEDGRRQADRTAKEVIERVRALDDGAAKAEETQQMIDRLRAFAGYREFPKYALVCRYAVYKSALMAEAGRLVDTGVLHAVDDVFFLTLEELCDVVRTHRVDADLIARRREELAADQALTPPRVLTSNGEALSGSYRRDDVPDGALPGLAVSSGVAEGRARVMRDISEADIDAGDILVTTFTDPSWSPLFVAIGALVTEVGGTMTHGAVVAREYGVPAVVGVQNATRLIRDGQRIRVHGTDGYVELLD